MPEYRAPRGASDLLPEAHNHNPSRLRVAVTLAGFAAIFAITQIAGH